VKRRSVAERVARLGFHLKPPRASINGLCAGIRQIPVFVDVLQKYPLGPQVAGLPANVATPNIHRFLEGFSLQTLDNPFHGVSGRPKPVPGHRKRSPEDQAIEIDPRISGCHRFPKIYRNSL
jgi:hypothetical protein